MSGAPRHTVRHVLVSCLDLKHHRRRNLTLRRLHERQPRRLLSRTLVSLRSAIRACLVVTYARPINVMNSENLRDLTVLVSFRLIWRRRRGLIFKACWSRPGMLWQCAPDVVKVRESTKTYYWIYAHNFLTPRRRVVLSVALLSTIDSICSIASMIACGAFDLLTRAFVYALAPYSRCLMVVLTYNFRLCITAHVSNLRLWCLFSPTSSLNLPVSPKGCLTLDAYHTHTIRVI